MVLTSSTTIQRETSSLIPTLHSHLNSQQSPIKCELEAFLMYSMASGLSPSTKATFIERLDKSLMNNAFIRSGGVEKYQYQTPYPWAAIN